MCVFGTYFIKTLSVSLLLEKKEGKVIDCYLHPPKTTEGVFFSVGFNRLAPQSVFCCRSQCHFRLDSLLGRCAVLFITSPACQILLLKRHTLATLQSSRCVEKGAVCNSEITAYASLHFYKQE